MKKEFINQRDFYGQANMNSGLKRQYNFLIILTLSIHNFIARYKIQYNKANSNNNEIDNFVLFTFLYIF